MEWFDVAIYGYFATDIGALFFPRLEGNWQLVMSFAVFAISYLMRPLGSLLLGPVGDLLGRKPMLILSVLVMGVCSLLIGLLPTYASWGLWASVGLLLLRMVQGLSLGGEYTGSIIAVVETSAPEQRGWRTAVAASGSMLGFVTGAIAAALIYSLLPRQAVLAWGWRLPFLAGGVVALMGMWLRSVGLPDQPASAAGELSTPGSLLRALWQQRLPFLQVMAALGFANVAFYTLFVFLVQSAISRSPHLAGAYSTATAVNQAIGFALVLLAGRLSDRYGALRCMRLSCIALGLALIPACLLIQQGPVLLLWFGQLLGVVPLMAVLGSFPSLLPGQFPQRLRCTGFSLSYSLAVALLGGTAPLMGSLLLYTLHWSWGPALYSVVWLPACLWALASIRSSNRGLTSPTAEPDPAGCTS